MASQLVIEKLRGAIVGPLDLTVPVGGCAAIAGPSGAGKSLLLRMIADLDVSEGSVRLGNMDRAGVTAPVWRRHVTYVAAEAGWWCARVADHFPSATRVAAADMAQRLGLDRDAMERSVATLSTGEKQRLALVRALVRRPRALLLDEPSSALDAASVEHVEALLRDTMADGTVLVLVTHDAAQAQRLGTARYRLEDGRLAPA